MSHEAHFAQVATNFLGYIRDRGTLPAWERPNMLAKYYVTTTGTELSRQIARAPGRPHRSALRVLPFETFVSHASGVPRSMARRDAYRVIRKAFRASMFPGQQLRMRAATTPIWRELADQLIGHGVRSYSIYLDPTTNDLFGYVEVASEEQWTAIQGADVCRRWWRYMREIMPARDDDSPVTADLYEVFHLEAP